MRKGLLSWSEAEVPKPVLEGRVARAQAAMRAAGLDVLLVYTNFPRPSGVSFLTHFVPYWSQGVLVVPPEGMPSLFVNLSKRVAGWMKETAHVAEVVPTPRLGITLAQSIARIAAGPARVGVVELAKFPASVLLPLAAEHGDVSYVDASGLFAGIRQPADSIEIALSRRAAAIARDAVETGIAVRAERTSTLAAAAEYAGRTGGAEEIIIDIAADVAAGCGLRRFEGDEILGERYALRASVAYKGHWVRFGRTIARGVGHAEDHTAAVVAAVSGMVGGGSAVPPGGGIDILAEVCVGCAPLSVVGAIPDGAVCSLTLMGQDWIESVPVIAGHGGPEPAVAEFI